MRTKNTVADYYSFKVKNAFVKLQDKLHMCCTWEEEELRQYFIKYEGFVKEEGKTGPRLLRIQNGTVLGVAHMDSVEDPLPLIQSLKFPNETRLYVPTLDDRLGVFTLVYLLPALNINVDILLSTNEEKGQTTAEGYLPKKSYNWLVSFDRTDMDVVLYCYYDSDMVSLLKEYNLTAGYGSNSCIRSLEPLGVKGFNFGVAYHDYHSQYAYMIVEDYLVNMTKFNRFYHDRYKQKLTHIKTIERTSRCGTYSETESEQHCHVALLKKYPNRTAYAKNPQWEIGKAECPCCGRILYLEKDGAVTVSFFFLACPQCEQKISWSLV